MHRLIVRGIAVLGSVALLSGATAAAVELGRDEPHAAAPVGNRPASPDALRYWNEARVALTPLLLYVRNLPETLTALEQAGGGGQPGQVVQAKEMADQFATARDLVGRLRRPASTTADVGQLLQLACELYRQAALSITGRQGLAGVHRAQSMRLIGDRLIDQTRRVLNIDGAAAGQAPVELRYAAAVPPIGELVPQPLRATGANLAANLRQAHALLADLTTMARTPTGENATVDQLAGIAAALDANPGPDREDVTGARLAILLGLLALQAEPSSGGALRMLSNGVWNTALTLVPVPVIDPLAASDIPRERVFTGGAFNGRPPVLKPGDDIGAGLPGGLPVLDPTQILRG